MLHNHSYINGCESAFFSVSVKEIKLQEVVNILINIGPISLCNFSYKTLTKVLTCRLRGVMEKIVSLNQCSFVPRRHSSDNITITQEVVHLMKNKRWKKR